MKSLTSEVIGSPYSPVVILSGGNPRRRAEIINLLSSLGDITVYGTLNEEEGIAKIKSLNKKVDLVVIGGGYTDDERIRIRDWISKNKPGVQITQPGFDYPYSNHHILKAVKEKVGL